MQDISKLQNFLVEKGYKINQSLTRFLKKMTLLIKTFPFYQAFSHGHSALIIISPPPLLPFVIITSLEIKPRLSLIARAPHGCVSRYFTDYIKVVYLFIAMIPHTLLPVLDHIHQKAFQLFISYISFLWTASRRKRNNRNMCISGSEYWTSPAFHFSIRTQRSKRCRVRIHALNR